MKSSTRALRSALGAAVLVGVAGVGVGMTWGSAALADQAGQLAALPTHVLDVVARSTDLGPSDPNRRLSIAVSMPYADAAGMQAFVDSVSDPASPEYRKFLTPEEVGARFGLGDKDVQSVVDYLKAAGFNVTLVGKNHLSILVDGTVAQAEKAFGTSIHEFQTQRKDELGNARYFSNTTQLTLPAAIAPFVIDVAGLESFTKPQLLALNPTQTRSLYNLAPKYSAGTQGQGRTVGVSNWTGFRTSNIPLYYSAYGLPAPAGGVGSNITVITSGGGSGGGTENAEGDLDQQMVLGMAPLCSLRVYDGAGSNSLINVLTLEANDNLADIITESYGWNISGSTLTSAHNLHVSMSAQGITYMAASGDNGTTLNYPYPDMEPEVLSVGGTVATVDGSGARSTEVGWSGSGGGWSTNAALFNVLPSWQHGTNVPTNVNHRLIPDVALNASGSGGAYYFYDGGSLTTGYIGTSFACPVFAGALAVAEEQIIAQGGLPPNSAGKRRFGRIQNLFYSQNGRSDVWHDITSGSNGALPGGAGTSAAAAGWDTVTGWGAIDFDAFVNSVICTAPGIGSSPTNVAVCTGSAATFSVSATGSSVSYQWRRGTTNLSDGDNISGSNTATLTISPAGTGDADANYNCLVTNGCGSAPSAGASLKVNSADFNGDGDLGTDTDIEAFFACLAGDCCPTCASADFNSDGDLGTDADIESFFRVLGGGSC